MRRWRGVLGTVWLWRWVVAGPAAILAGGVAVAFVVRPASASEFPDPMLPAAAAFIPAAVFLATFSRHDPYEEAAEELAREDAKLADQAAVGQTASLDHLYQLRAYPLFAAAYVLESAADPVQNPPQLFSRDRLAARSQEFRADELLSDYDPVTYRWVKSVVQTDLATEARVVMVAYLAAGAITTAVIAGGAAGWGWSTNPAPEFFGLVAVVVAAMCVCGVTLAARHSRLRAAQLRFGADFIPTASLAVSTWEAGRDIDKERGSHAVVQWALVRDPRNRYARTLVAALLLDEPSRCPGPLDQNKQQKVRDARDLLAPMATKLPPPTDSGKRWQWRSPDLTTALLLLRAGELLEDDRAALDELRRDAEDMCARWTMLGLVGCGVSGALRAMPALLPIGFRLNDYGSVSAPKRFN